MAEMCAMPNWNGRFTIKLIVDFVRFLPTRRHSREAGIQLVIHAKRKSNIFVCHDPAHAAGQLPFLLRQKSNPKKATPTIGLILRCSEKSGTARNSLRSNNGPF